MRGIVVRLLVGAVIATILLPIAVAVVLGLAALLGGLGDTVAAVACQRVALVGGVLWILAIIVTSVCSGLVAMDVASLSARHAGPRQGEETAG